MQVATWGNWNAPKADVNILDIRHKCMSKFALLRLWTLEASLCGSHACCMRSDILKRESMSSNYKNDTR